MPIEVVVPVPDDVPSGDVRRAPAAQFGSDAVIALISNGKHRARDVLVAVAERLIASGRAGSYVEHAKPSASAPIDTATRTRMLARARIVLTGVGD